MDPKIYFSQGARHFSLGANHALYSLPGPNLYRKAGGKDHGNNDETL